MSVFDKVYINNLLNEKQIKLPDDFYNYLTNISKNKLIFYFYNDFNNDKNYKENIKIPKFYDNSIYEYNIDIEKIPNNTHKQVSIPLNVTKLSYYFPEVKYSEDDIERTTNNNICINDVKKWMLEIADGNKHYFPYYIYLGNGPHFGSIWINNDSSIYLEFPEFTKVFTSFNSFLNSVNEYKNSDNSYNCDYDSDCDCEEVLLCE